MSIHASLSEKQGVSSVKVAMGFEDGRVELWALGGSTDWKTPSDGRTRMTPWQRRYEGKKHNEAGKSIPEPNVARDCTRYSMWMSTC